MTTLEKEDYGALKGVVFPDTIPTVVYLVAEGDSLSTTIPEKNGTFVFEWLEAGHYDVVAVPSDSSGLSVAVASAIGVMMGVTTEVDTLKFGE